MTREPAPHALFLIFKRRRSPAILIFGVLALFRAMEGPSSAGGILTLDDPNPVVAVSASGSSEVDYTGTLSTPGIAA
jgi:hypothetical protein